MNQILKTMTLILKRILHSSLLVVLVLAVPQCLFAQSESLSMSISPTLFEMSANPGQEWSSVIRVVNPNPHELSIYTDVVNFAPQGEAGQGVFIPLGEGIQAEQTLGSWISFTANEYTIRPEQTVEIPFTVTVPANAPPGGHYAAVLIGTRSLNTGSGSTVVETSQVITSLMFLSVSGEVIEKGSIREFQSEHGITEKPEMTFNLRFQNSGNVHVLPQGDIKIFNMWGQERGVIPVNRQTLFGNVLPDSIRKYSFSWSGEWSLADMGRYTAVATLAYGQGDRQFVSAETSFWIVPWKMLLLIIVSLCAFVVLLVFAVKAYIRKMLAMAGITPEIAERQQYKVLRTRRVSVVAPIEEGILDLRDRFQSSATATERLRSIGGFAMQYKLFLFVSLLVLSFVVILIWYIQNASVDERPYEVVIDGFDSDVAISSEQVQYDTLKEVRAVTVHEVGATVRDFPAIKIVNQSGVSGLAAELRLSLETQGYPISMLSNELNMSEENTVIVYAPEFDEEALELSGKIYGALTSAFPEISGTETPIIIYVGKDIQNAVQ